MKKFLTMLLAAAMIFTLVACGMTPNEADNSNTQDDHQAETPDTSYEAPQITELYNEDFDYTDGVGNSGHYTYRVPQIESDTQGAEAINKASPMSTALSWTAYWKPLRIRLACPASM